MSGYISAAGAAAIEKAQSAGYVVGPEWSSGMMALRRHGEALPKIWLDVGDTVRFVGDELDAGYVLFFVEAERHWAQVPDDTDVLVTHGPPYGILDKNLSGQRIGDAMLYKRVEKIRPRLHLFGHVHECGGHKLERFGTRFVNAAIGDNLHAPNLSARIQVVEVGSREI